MFSDIKAEQQQPDSQLRDSAWACCRFGYRYPEQRSAFFQWLYANGVPHVRTGRRKIQFCERQIEDWIARRSSGNR